MSGKPTKNKAGLSSEELQSLRKRLDRLDKLGNGLGERALCYVVDDADEQILPVLQALDGAAEALQLNCGSQHGPSADSGWCSFINTVGVRDAGLCLRLSRVFEAAARLVPRDRFYCRDQYGGALWLEILLQEGSAAHVWRMQSCAKALSGPLIERMLALDGRTPHAFVTAAFAVDQKNLRDMQVRQMVLLLTDLGTTLAAHRDLVAPFLTTGTAEARRLAIENLAISKAPVATFGAELAACATDSSKHVREEAAALLQLDLATARPHLERLARGGNSGQRSHAVRMLAAIVGPAAHPFLESLIVGERSKPVLEVLATVLKDLSSNSSPGVQPHCTPLLHVPLNVNAPVSAALREVLSRILEEYNARCAEHNRALADPVLKNRVYPPSELPLLTADWFADVCGLLEHGFTVDQLRADVSPLTYMRSRFTKSDREFIEHPDCQLIHVLRLLALTGMLPPHQAETDVLSWPAVEQIEMFRRAHAGANLTLKHLAEGLASLGLPNTLLVRSMLRSLWTVFDWDADAVWPFFLEHLEALRGVFDPVSSSDYIAQNLQRSLQGGAFRILATFPHIPPELMSPVWEFAIGGTQDERRQAQLVAAKLPDVQDRLAQAIRSGNYQTRVIAAEWLGRLGDRRAVPALDAAVRTEKQNAAIDAMLTALERLGQPIEPYLDRDRLARDAAKGLKKGIPADLAWFPWATLPAVYWEDTGEQASVEVITWLLVQNYKLKSAEAGPLLRRCCALLRAPGREHLGDFVLQAWLTQDLHSKYTEEEARALARQKAQAAMAQVQHATQWYQQHNMPPSPQLSWSQSQWEDAHYKQILQTGGSAVNTKGILAVAGACCGAAALAPVQKYLKDWYGYRAAQCKALIAMLSTVESPAAIQYLLSISNRFRTKGIREEAEKYVNLLAERKGWTLDELGDRTLPTAGLDDDGTLVLDFGPRTFLLRVNADLDVVLSDADGNALKTLPAPRKDDDAELAQAAKKSFSAAKSEVKKFAALQRTRLYEAMCTQRSWPIADWRRYLLEHPLMRFLCQRIVWSSWSDGELQQTFRPLDDGTFTDASDTEITLANDVTIRIAHDCEVAPELSAAWVRHLADYDVEMLFVQFGRGTWRLTDEQRRNRSIDDFQGHLVEAFKLRGLATKLGYTRGQTEDGGWFYEYTRSFPGLELAVHLGFSGNGLPEENRTVALTSLTFRRRSGDSAGVWNSGGGIPLEDVPAILVSECYHDLRAIAATGSGFDPEWEKKVDG